MYISKRIQIGKFAKRLSFYVSNFATYTIPSIWFRWRRDHILSTLTGQEKQEMERRARYYCQLENLDNGQRLLGEDALTVGEFKYPWGQKHKFVTYFFDLYNVLKYFPTNKRFHRIFGDVNYAPSLPAFVKSRPIGCQSAVVLKLNQVRHFRFTDDTKLWSVKKNKIVFRNNFTSGQTQRITFMERYFGHPLADAGFTNTEPVNGHKEWNVGFMTIDDMLQYKFIACIEGNDVATNLKWVMSSNSIAVSPPMKFETWFMEGQLKADYHYIEVKSDYSDLEEKLEYYIQHPDEAQTIINHAHEYISQFKHKRLELATQLIVAQRYFSLTNN